jgi:hypothetical protein
VLGGAGVQNAAAVLAPASDGDALGALEGQPSGCTALDGQDVDLGWPLLAADKRNLRPVWREARVTGLADTGSQPGSGATVR